MRIITIAVTCILKTQLQLYFQIVINYNYNCNVCCVASIIPTITQVKGERGKPDGFVLGT